MIEVEDRVLSLTLYKDESQERWECEHPAGVAGCSRTVGRVERLKLAFHAFHRPAFPRLVFLLCFGSFLLPLESPSEAIRFSSGFEDVRSVGDAIQQSFTKPGIRNHLRPF